MVDTLVKNGCLRIPAPKRKKLVGQKRPSEKRFIRYSGLDFPTSMKARHWGRKKKSVTDDLLRQNYLKNLDLGFHSQIQEKGIRRRERTQTFQKATDLFGASLGRIS